MFHLQEAPPADFFQQNAYDLIPYRIGRRAVGEIDESRLAFGTEVTVSSIRLVFDSVQKRWVIDDVGRWALHRFFTKPQTGPDPLMVLPVQVADVPYRRQWDSKLCQSAALQMIFEHVTGGHYEGGQRAIRESLGDEPLSHAARVRWAQDHMPGVSWEFNYCDSMHRTASLLRRGLKAGIPMALSTRLTRDGHVIVVTGLEVDDQGEIWVRANDPWGEFNFLQRSYDTSPGKGKGVRYPLAELCVRNRVWRSPDSTREVLQVYVGGDEFWLPNNESLRQQGLIANELLVDWEWLGPQIVGR